MKIVADNPEDPIFYSTCYSRLIIKEWLPLEADGRGPDESGEMATSFMDGKHCLSCASYRDNYVGEATYGYNMTTMPARQWWLKEVNCPCSSCADEGDTVSSDSCPTSMPTSLSMPTQEPAISIEISIEFTHPAPPTPTDEANLKTAIAQTLQVPMGGIVTGVES